jgi:hypothetical protein
MTTSRYRTKSVFDFEDEYGSDPIIARYGATPSRTRSYQLRGELATADRLDAEAELAQAQAEEEAKLAPLRAVSERFKIINDLSSQRSKLEEDARTKTALTNFNQNAPKVGNVMELDKLVADNADVVLDQPTQIRIGYLRNKFAERDKADLRTRLPGVMSPEDVDKLELWAGERQLLGDAEVKTMLDIWRGVAAKKGSAIKGLTQLGAQSMPVTPQGEFDVSRAENIVETLGRTDIRTLSAAQRGLQQQLANIDDPESPEAAALQSDLTNINRQIANVANRSDQQTTRATMDLQSLGGANPDWIDDIIGGGSDAPDSPPTSAPTTAPGSSPVPSPQPDLPAPATPSPQTDSAEPEKKEKPKPYDPKDRAELARLELEVQRAREEAGLTDQPAGIRQINESLAAQNAPVREKVAQLEAAQERINPFAEADARDAQTIQAALDVVYPEMDGGGFDVGSTEDSRVVSAAEFLRRVDPSLLRMVASSPGSNRAGLSLEEISNIATKATRPPRGRKAN